MSLKDNNLSTIVLVNQTANYLFADIIKAFAAKFPTYTIEAWYGSFDDDISKLPANVVLKQGPKYDRERFSKRVKSWLRFYFWIRKQLRAVDIKSTGFFFVSNPPLFVWVPKINQMNFDCLIYDLYPDVLGDMRKKALVNTIAKRWEKKNKQVLLKAQHIYTIGEGLKTAISQYLPENMSSKVQVVPVWNKKINSNQVSTRDFRREWELANKKVILYSGNIGLTHPLEHLVDLAKQLQNNNDWKVVVVGSGSKRIQLEQQARGLNNILFKDPVPLYDLRALLSIASWGYVTLDSSASNTSVPSKTYNLLAAGVPILALVNEQSDIAKLADKYNVGICFREQELTEVANKIVAVGDDELNTLSSNARKTSTYFTAALANTFADNWKTVNV